MHTIQRFVRRGLRVSLLSGVLLAGWGAAAQAASSAAAPHLSGTWALEGTGPAGLVASGGRLGTLHLQQQGHQLRFTLSSGRQRYRGSGVVAWPPVQLRMTWKMAGVGTIHFEGGLQAGGRILGQWSDGHGDDGGAILVRVAR